MKLQIQVDGTMRTFCDENLDPCYRGDPYNYWFQIGNNIAFCDLKVPTNQQELPDAFWHGVESAEMAWEELGQAS